MKKWNRPEVTELNVRDTMYSPMEGSKVDGSYISEDGKYVLYTYGPSGASNEIPR